MIVPFSRNPAKLPGMKTLVILLALAACTLPADAETRRNDRRSLLQNDPEVVYLDRYLEKPYTLKVIKAAPVFSDKEGRHRLGTLRENQTVRLEAVTGKVYRVRGEGTHNGIAGWVAPWAFEGKSPDFREQLRKFYERQIQVQELIAAKQVAVGMTLAEVTEARGKPTKTRVRKTGEGQAGRWEWIDYDEVKHYVTRVDPVNGAVYRQFSHLTQVEKGKTAVEFENGVVTAVEESENNEGGNVRIVVPPIVFGW